ncbi:hypothetical protein ROS62_03995 [Streptomyces sp. DSM 41972]|uniref:Integral membrane protein n=1 Tax=Streptomyces althioticus subsp. attaecolombicae TaxID=3075534 RepID=A0ABU3HTR1_9ACTN|nr:hypothetical protein [Streptomyces sp. DSM 41972]SCD57474.1 hypothetical protein GA0115245_109411 [Streptomyces sp. di188]SCD58169.1 hypothetical protein GA0115238_116312 [Streptomyces sp. di50b]
MTDLSELDRGAAPGAADPVKVLLHRHRELCERAVDPLEIAAGLEAHGITDRTAARFRHRDVFSLAEELYARVPRDADTASDAPAAPDLPAREKDRRRSVAVLLLPLLPGTLCAAALIALARTHGQTRLYAAAAGLVAVALALRATLRRGPLALTDALASRSAAGTWTCLLLAYAVLGDGLLRTAVTGGPDGLPDGTTGADWPLALAPLLALTLAVAPATWTAGLFLTHARRKLAASRGLEDFAASVRPVLLGAVALFLGALAALVALCAPFLDAEPVSPSVLALGALLLVARLLTVHGFTHAPRVILMLTAVAQVLAPATVFAARLPGCAALGAPVEALTAAWGPTAVPVLACGAGASILLVHASRTLAHASAHLRPEQAR